MKVYERTPITDSIDGCGAYLGLVLHHEWWGWLVEAREGWHIGPFDTESEAIAWLRSWGGWSVAA